MSQPLSPGFTPANALSTLLTTESLLFAAFSLAVNLSGPTNRVRGWLLPGRALAGVAVVALALVGCGAGVAWHDIFLSRGLSQDGSERVIACAVIGAIAIQPVLAFFLAMGLRTRE